MLMFCAFQVTTGMEKPDGIYSFTFVVDEFSGIFPHPSFSNILVSAVGAKTLQKSLF